MSTIGLKVLVCGGRTFYDIHRVRKELAELHDHSPIACVIHGDAPGADTCADEAARSLRIHVVRVPALWNELGNIAGPSRNSVMAFLKPDLCIAYPGARGTADMVRKIKSADIRIRDYSRETRTI